METRILLSFLSRASFHIFCLETLEGSDVHVGDQGVQLVDGVFVLVTHAGQTNANTERNVPKKTTKIN